MGVDFVCQGAPTPFQWPPATNLIHSSSELARFTGTSAEQIDKTYGHLLPDALEQTRVTLATVLAQADERGEANG